MDSSTESNYIPFDNHDAACKALRDCGYDPTIECSFTSEELCGKMSDHLNSFTTVNNMTSVVPLTSAAAYHCIGLATKSALKMSRIDKNAIFVLMRTQFNTPSFLFGIDNTARALGATQEDVKARAIATETPGALIFFREKVICVPTSTLHAPVDLSARAIAQALDPESTVLTCGACSTRLSTIVDSTVVVEELGVGDDGSVMRASCCRLQSSAKA